MEKYAEHTKPLCMALTDYEKAFDSVGTSVVMQVLRKHLFPIYICEDTIECHL